MTRVASVTFCPLFSAPISLPLPSRLISPHLLSPLSRIPSVEGGGCVWHAAGFSAAIGNAWIFWLLISSATVGRCSALTAVCLFVLMVTVILALMQKACRLFFQQN